MIRAVAGNLKLQKGDISYPHLNLTNLGGAAGDLHLRLREKEENAETPLASVCVDGTHMKAYTDRWEKIPDKFYTSSLVAQAQSKDMTPRILVASLMMRCACQHSPLKHLRCVLLTGMVSTGPIESFNLSAADSTALASQCGSVQRA
jgi:hypothetical protein